MRGLGQYVGDIRLPGMQDVAFVRSPLAHARIRGVDIPEAVRDRVFTAADLDGVRAIRAVSGLPGFKVSEQPPLATGKVRHVGELIAMCVAPTRAEAEDIAASVDSGPRGAAGRPRHAGGAPAGLHARARALGRQRLSRDVHRHRHRRGLRCADQGHAHDLDRAPVHGADRGARLRRRARPSRRPARAPHRKPDAACHSHRPRRMPRPGGRPRPHRLARRRRRLRLQGHPARRGNLPRLARASPPPCRCAGSRTAAST